MMLAAATHPILLPLAGLGGAKALFLLMIIALPLILVIGIWLRRSRSR